MRLEVPLPLLSLLLHCFLLHLPCLMAPVDGFVAVAVEGWGRGRLIRTLDAGQTWTPLIECYIDLQAVDLPSPYSVVAVGVNGTIIRASTNATLPANLTGGSNSSLSPSFPFSYASRYHGSYLSLVQRYSDLTAAANSSSTPSLLEPYYSALYPPPYATAWTLTPLPYLFSLVTPTTTSTFTSVAFLTPLLGLAVGTSGSIYRSQDGGLSFTAVASPITLDLSGLAFSASDSACVVLACGSVGAVLVSSDWGQTWAAANTSSAFNLYDVAMWDAAHAVACGDSGTLLATADGGGTWTDLSPALYSNRSFNSVAYLSLSSLFVAASQSLLLHSTDGGASFAPVTLPPSNFFESLTSLFFTPSLLALAGRSQLYTAAPASPARWTSGGLLNINRISSAVLMEAAVVKTTPAVFNLSTFCGADLDFNVSLSNTGTEGVNVTGVSSSDPYLVLDLPVDAALFFPFTLWPSSVPRVLSFSYQSSLLPSTTATYYTNLTLLTTAPTQRSHVYFSVYTLPTPSTSSASFLSQYWYVVALIAGAVSVLVFVFVRRRLKYIRKWNRRVLYEDEKISFWGCWLLSKEMEHDSDSEFWSEDDDDDQGPLDEGDEGDGWEDWTGDTDRTGGSTSKGFTEEKEAGAARRRGRGSNGASTSSRAGGEEDGEWEDEEGDEAFDPNNDLGDDEDSDSSISDQGHTALAAFAAPHLFVALTLRRGCCSAQTTTTETTCGGCTALAAMRRALAKASSSADADAPPLTRPTRPAVAREGGIGDCTHWRRTHIARIHSGVYHATAL